MYMNFNEFNLIRKDLFERKTKIDCMWEMTHLNDLGLFFYLVPSFCVCSYTV